jgi:hypothetical protein
MSILGNALGIDPNTLKKELSKFQQTQIETNALLKENNQLLTQILIQLGGKPAERLEIL